MNSFVVVGIAAGLAAAVLFATVATGSALAVFLFYAAPLPILIAGLGWRHYAGLIATVVAAVVLAIAFDVRFVFAFVIGIGLPAWMVAYLAMLARHDGAGDVEWFPIGQIVFWAAVISGLSLSIGILSVGGTDYAATLHHAIEQVLRTQTGTPANAPLSLPNVTDTGAVIDAMVVALPPAAAVLSMVTLLGNLWCAGLIVRRSGRLTRPWPAFDGVRLPSFALPALACAFAAALLGDLIGLIARVFVANLTTAYGLAGISAVHALSRGIAGRTAILAGLYAGIVLFSGWPFVIAAIIGIGDSLFDLRHRFRGRRGPPAAND